MYFEIPDIVIFAFPLYVGGPMTPKICIKFWTCKYKTIKERTLSKYSSIRKEFLIFSGIDFVLLTATKKICSSGLCPYLTLTLLNL
jgi:hypothetical protein